MLKQLSDQDASYLYLETAQTPQHVGGVNFIEIPPDYPHDFFEVYKAHIKSRMHLVPLLYSKLLELPFDLDRPFWVEDELVDIDYHVRHETLPRPGSLKQLEELVGRLHSGLLDRSRPLWEFHVIDGLENGQVAIYTKIHHAAMDGASSQTLVAAMYDPSPAPRVLPPPPASTGKSRGDFESVVQGVMTHFVRQEIRAAQFVPEMFKVWTNLFLPNAETLRFPGLPRAPHTPRTLLNVGITNQRLYAARTLSLPELKKLSKLTGTTLNAVFLAVCSGALRTYLQKKGGLPAEAMTTMVPVSMRDEGDRAAANHNAMFVCSLATNVADPLERLNAIHQSALDQRRRLDNVRNLLLPDLAIVGIGGVMRHLVELYGRAKLAQRLPLLGNLTISNVPGPPIPLYLAGLKVLSLYPCSIPFHGSALNITVQSYGDRLDVGLVACRRAVPDLGELADGLLRAWEELQASVVQHLSSAVAGPSNAAPQVAPKVKPRRERAARSRPAKAAKPAQSVEAERVVKISEIVQLKPKARAAESNPEVVDRDPTEARPRSLQTTENQS